MGAERFAEERSRTKPAGRLAGLAALVLSVILAAPPAFSADRAGEKRRNQPQAQRSTSTAVVLPRSKPTPPSPAPASIPASAAAPKPIGPASLVIRSSWQEERHFIRFDWSRPVAAAVFRRGARIWVVFDAPAEPRFADPKKAELIQPVQHPSATVLRIVAPHGFNPTVTRAGSAWAIDLQDQALRPEHPVAVETRSEPEPRVQFALRYAAGPVEIVDPDLGERLRVVTTGALGHGLLRTMSFVDFQALATVQGLAFEAAGDGLTIAAREEGVEVTAREGLTLAAATAKSVARPAPGRLFDLQAWSAAPGKHLEKRRHLVEAAASAAVRAQTRARLDLARFYFAEGLAAEAHGVLDVVARDDPGAFADPTAQLLRGAAAFMAGDVETAERELAAKILDNEPEGQLWRGAAAAARGDGATAMDRLAKGAAILATYPKRLRHALALLGAEAATVAASWDTVRKFLEPTLSEQPDAGARGRALLLIANMHRQQGDLDKAVAIWDELVAGPDSASRNKARLERTLVLLARGRISRPDAIEQLETIRSEWRGDAVEFTTLRHLGALRAAEGDWRGGFEAYRLVQKNFGEHPEAKAVAQEAADAVATLVESATFAQMPPLPALALFEQYRDLLPRGARGDALAAKVADRLIAVDLLREAGSVLEAQLKDRPADAQTAQLTTRLAVLRLKDRKPEAALAALELPVVDVTPERARERDLLKARALGELGRAAEAIAALGEDESPESDHVRLDILFRAKEWNASLPVFARLAPPARTPLDDAAARLVLNWATAATLAGDSAALATIREGYGAAMDRGPHKRDFRRVVDDGRAPPKKAALTR